MKLIVIVCFILIALPIAASANNADLRCGPYIISSGDTQSEVLQKCGQPSNIETWEEERIRRDFYRNIPVQSPEELSQEPLLVKEHIKIEEWEYNFGPTRFIYCLRFENGKLRSITSGDYGYYR
jgi:deoxyribodipyrimidine photolyase